MQSLRWVSSSRLSRLRWRQALPAPRPATPSSKHHLARPICSTGVRVIAHHACFDVARLNHTAHRHGLRSELRSATLLCTMHSATKHCKLRCKGVPTGFYSVRLWASALNPETPCA